MNVEGRWLKRPSSWRKLALNTWSTPDNATIYGALEIDVGKLDAYLRERSEQHGVKCTMTHAVSRALAMLLRRHPECNVLVRGRRIWLRRDVDVFHQVAVPSKTGGQANLSGAVVRCADTKKVHEIAQELRQRAEAVRTDRDPELGRTQGLFRLLPGALLRTLLGLLGLVTYRWNLRVPGSPRDAFGSAMVTSVGMLGIRLAYAPLVTFSRCPIVVLIGQVEDRAVVREGQIVIRPMCTVTATLDHRVLDGVQAGTLASEMQRLLEQPELLDKEPAEID
jgi:pyruvate/2-oxoglutarate dehydrogenase complex dihydrolipoamide acyltransferase (E2) component